MPLTSLIHLTPYLPTVAAVERWPKWGCCNRRLLCLENGVAKIYFRTQHFIKTIICVSKQQPHADKSPETPPTDGDFYSRQWSPFHLISTINIPTWTRTVAAVERWPKWSCCNRRLLALEECSGENLFSDIAFYHSWYAQRDDKQKIKIIICYTERFFSKRLLFFRCIIEKGTNNHKIFRE